MAREKNGLRDRILDCAIECIEKEGGENVTVRSICKAANANIASINYYFRSKDNLIKEALGKTLQHAFENHVKEADALRGDIAKKLEHVFRHLLVGGVNYPGITRANFHDALIEGNYNNEFIQRMNWFMGELAKRVVASGRSRNLAETQRRLAKAMSSLMFFCLMPLLYKDCFGLDFSQAKTQNEFIRSLVNDILK